MTSSLKDEFNAFIESICTMFNAPGAIPLLQEGANAMFEAAHRDRTTGSNYSGKTLRDQNNYDERLRHSDDDKTTKTAKATNDKYGYTAGGVKGMGISGKFGDAWTLHNDGYRTTGANSALCPSARREMKRKFNDAARKEMNAELANMKANTPTGMSNSYQPMTMGDVTGSKTASFSNKPVDPALFSDTAKTTLGDINWRGNHGK